jgi:uncharacterized protein (TIGR02391 family)
MNSKINGFLSELLSREQFDWRRNGLNVVLAFSGFYIREDGQVIRATQETTLAGAKARAGRLKATLEARGTHPEIFKYCRAELLEENYFQLSSRRQKVWPNAFAISPGLTLMARNLSPARSPVKSPIVAFNSLQSETERSEQKGIANLMTVLFGAIRNPTAHAPKIAWTMPEEDAIDVFALVSFLHRKLDNVVKL